MREGERALVRVYTGENIERPVLSRKTHLFGFGAVESCLV